MKGKRGPFTVLDIRCQRGWALLNLRHLAGHGGELICFDLDPDGQPCRLDNFKKAHTEVKGLSTEIIFDLFDPSKLALESVNVFLRSHTFEHTHDPCALLEGLDRVLKPDGIVFTEVPDDSRDTMNCTIVFTTT